MQTQLLIGGEWLDGSGGDRIEVENPATEDVVTTVAAGTPADATAACDAAARPSPAGPPPRRANAARSCGRAGRRSSITPTSWRR